MREYTREEEVASSAMHAVGAVLAVAGLAVLVTLAALRGTAWHVVSCGIYGTTLVALYTASAFYHGLKRPRVKHVFHVLDHMSIYLLIAGTYTPFMLVSLRGPWGWSLFGVIWGLAIAGIVFKGFFVHRFAIASTAVYLLMGWMIVIAFRPLLRVLPGTAIGWIAAGGLCYTIGVVAYALKQVRHHHAVWHLFVLAGSLCHFFAIMFHVIPRAH